MLLFDQNISFRIVRHLRALYPKCRHVSDAGLMGASDRRLRAFARIHGLAIVTFDEDHLALAALEGAPPKVILLRLGNSATLALAHRLREEHERILEFLVGAMLADQAVLEIA